MSTATEKDPRTVQFKRVRLSFTDSLKDKKATVEDGKPKHGCNILFETDQPGFEQNKAKAAAAMLAAAEKAWPTKGEAKLKGIAEDNPKRLCFRKGERFKNSDGKVYAGYEGNFALSGAGPSAGDRRPKLLDRHKREVAEADILDVCYGGSYADVIVSFYGTDKGGDGVFCSIEAIRSHQEGERMGGGLFVSADDFDDLPEDDAFEGTAAGATGGGDDFLG